MFDDVGGDETAAGDRLGSLTAALHAQAAALVDLTADGVMTDGIDAAPDDAALIDGLTALEAAKAACAAAQARLTERFVASQAGRAERLREQARACADAGDFDGWVLARDQARALELAPEPDLAAAGHRRGRHASTPVGGQEPGAPSRTSRRLMLSRTGVSAQVALARRESPARGARLATASVALVRHLPRTLEALSAGVLNERRAELVVRATSHLEPAVRARVDAEVIGAGLDVTDPGDPTSGVGGWGDRELERRVRACADRLDAEAAVARARIAETERRVTIRPVPDTMALVTALLPVAQPVAVHAALTRAALSAKAAGDIRGKGQLMADTLVERLTGQAGADEVPIEIQLVMTDRALLAGDATPAHVPGYGPVPAGWARDLLVRATTPTPDPPLGRGSVVGSDVDSAVGPRTGASTASGAASGAADENGDRVIARGAPGRAWVRRLFTHPDTGTLVAMDSSRRLFPAALRRFVIARDGTCRTPWCDAPVAHLDHVTPHADGGPTSATNGQGLCVRCNLVKEQPGWHSRVIEPGPTHRNGAPGRDGPPHTVEVTAPTGHRYTSTSPPVLPMAHRPRRLISSMPAAPPPPGTEAAVGPGRPVVLELYPPMAFDVELAC